MNLLTPDLSRAPGARIIVNSLYDSREPDVLTQDLLLVELPGGIYIDISWLPEYCLLGSYVITVFCKNDYIYQIKTLSAQEAIGSVERLAHLVSECVRITKACLALSDG